MVLGLGSSRSKKDRAASAASALVDLELRLHEIKPWQINQRRSSSSSSSKSAPPSIVLRWNRGEKAVGTSKVLNPNPNGDSSESGSFALEESIRISVAPNRDALKRAKKLLPDLDRPLIFSVLEANNLKAQPIAIATLDLTPFVLLPNPQAFSVPFSVSKKIASKGINPRLHFTVSIYHGNEVSANLESFAASANSTTSSRNSDASSAPPMDEETQRSLVASLLSDDDDDDEDGASLASFTDDDDDSEERDNRGSNQTGSATKPVHPTVAMTTKGDTTSQKLSNPPIGYMEKQPGKADDGMPRHLIPSPQASPARAASAIPQASPTRAAAAIPQASPTRAAAAIPQASPARAAAIAAATAYSAKHSFLARPAEPDINQRRNSYWDPDSDEEDDYSTHTLSRPAPTGILPKNTPTRDIHNGLKTGTTETTKAEAGSSRPIPTITKDSQKGLNNNSTSPISKDSMKTSDSSVVENSVLLTETNRNLNNPRISKAESKYQSETLKTVAKPSVEEKHVLEQQSLNQAATRNANSDEKSRIPKSPKMPDRKSESPKSFERKAGAEVKNKLSPRGKSTTTEANVQKLESEIEKLESELRDVATLESALYSTTAEHGGSSTKLHAPARRLARMYTYASRHLGKERRASCAWNTVSGLVLVARACGNDVPRLTFWWSNATVLREIICATFNILVTDTHKSPKLRSGERQNVRFLKDKPIHHQQQFAIEDWREPTTFIAALERLEAWIYSKVVESIWWQVLTPHMQQPIDDIPSDTEQEVGAKNDGKKEKVFHTELEDGRQGSISVGIWKKAISDAYEKLCPVRSLGVECGCLPMINKMVLETCLVRLDVAMFNAILRDDDAPTDPISDPITDKRCLPIASSSLSFGLGAQLKNAVATLASWIANLVNKDEDTVADDEDERSMVMFPLLKAVGGFLMLPKDMLMDSSLRKEVCPTLNLTSMARILSRFKPDEFSPDPVSQELLDTIDIEIAAENQMQEDADDLDSILRIAFAPPVTYSPPQSNLVRLWIGDTPSNNGRLSRSNSSILRKGHTSDDEIDELESPISWLLENTASLSTGGRDHANGKVTKATKETVKNARFKLLRDVWSNQ